VFKLRLAVLVSVVGVALATTLVAPTGAGADDGPGGDAKRVRVMDDCDPATFNAAFGDGTCARPGNTTVDELLAQLAAKGKAAGWAFKPGTFHLNSDDSIKAVNTGGEFHTFTEVSDFGGGCFEPLNQLLGLTPVAECDEKASDGTPLPFITTGLPSGGVLHVDPLDPGTHMFECMIHPWMRATVEVRGNHGD
jgi:hypothetical protein